MINDSAIGYYSARWSWWGADGPTLDVALESCGVGAMARLWRSFDEVDELSLQPQNILPKGKLTQCQPVVDLVPNCGRACEVEIIPSSMLKGFKGDRCPLPTIWHIKSVMCKMCVDIVHVEGECRILCNVRDICRMFAVHLFRNHFLCVCYGHRQLEIATLD